MAVTYTVENRGASNTGGGYDFTDGTVEVGRGHKVVRKTMRFSWTYTPGGFAVDPADFGLEQILWADTSNTFPLVANVTVGGI